MKKIIGVAGWLVMAAALSLGLSACSGSEDSIIGQPANSTEKTYTMTVKASKGENNALARAIAAAGSDGATRALDYDASTKTISATWNVGDEIRVLKCKQQSINADYALLGTLTATTVSNDRLTATFSGSLEPDKISAAGGLAAGDKLVLGFPASKLGNISTNSFLLNYTGQDGTLGKIATDYDFCMTKTYGSNMVTVASVDESTGIVTTTADAEFQNQQAIVRFTFYESDGTTAILPKSLDITAVGLVQSVFLPETGDGMASPSEKTLTLTLGGKTNVVYAALRGISGQTVKLTATYAANKQHTSTTKNPVTFKNGQFYDIKVKMNTGTVNLSEVTASGLTDATLTLEDGMTLTGTLDGSTEEGKVKIQIADGATVTLNNAHINGYNYGGGNDTECLWAGITCLGDATIVLSGENSVSNFNYRYPAILAAHNASGSGNEYTLTIRGNGKLTASSNGSGAGIGGGLNISCGNILIEGGDITATGGLRGAGIGSGQNGSCNGGITINGTANVTATGGDCGAGIGSGDGGSCNGGITINGTANVTANGGDNAAGIGSGLMASCGDITISGGTVTANGGTVTANGGNNAAGIGSGIYGKFNSITITDGITSVVATSDSNSSAWPIGLGSFDQSDDIVNGIYASVNIGGAYFRDIYHIGIVDEELINLWSASSSTLNMEILSHTQSLKFTPKTAN